MRHSPRNDFALLLRSSFPVSVSYRNLTLTAFECHVCDAPMSSLPFYLRSRTSSRNTDSDVGIRISRLHEVVTNPSGLADSRYLTVYYSSTSSTSIPLVHWFEVVVSSRVTGHSRPCRSPRRICLKLDPESNTLYRVSYVDLFLYTSTDL